MKKFDELMKESIFPQSQKASEGFPDKLSGSQGPRFDSHLGRVAVHDVFYDSKKKKVFVSYNFDGANHLTELQAFVKKFKK